MHSLLLLKVGIFYALLSLSAVQSKIISTNLFLVEFGTFNATNMICFDKEILKFASSPKSFVFNNPSAKNITYIKVEQLQQRLGGIAASITNGAIGTTSVTLQVSAAQDGKLFLGDVEITMMCVS
ncbi:uncharacterized protein LOC129724516 [Wyeomyia smithii]|uniref:uncharacterized protein LOC129724516 n=1 Tax=Wyeomyia smithii TaxID=174621 RepID=UPI002467DC84|nr:uncharacterized protein LOC129724516 [Wyeomyia smithii]